MKLDTLIEIFELFFGKLEFEVDTDKFRTRLYCIYGTVKNIVQYDKDENHLQVFSVNLNTDELYTCIIEGSPEDIIKLSKILEQ